MDAQRAASRASVAKQHSMKRLSVKPGSNEPGIISFLTRSSSTNSTVSQPNRFLSGCNLTSANSRGPSIGSQAGIIDQQPSMLALSSTFEPIPEDTPAAPPTMPTASPPAPRPRSASAGQSRSPTAAEPFSVEPEDSFDRDAAPSPPAMPAALVGHSLTPSRDMSVTQNALFNDRCSRQSAATDSGDLPAAPGSPVRMCRRMSAAVADAASPNGEVASLHVSTEHAGEDDAMLSTIASDAAPLRSCLSSQISAAARRHLHVAFAPTASVHTTPGVCFGALRAAPEAMAWDDLGSAVFYRHLPNDIARGAAAWPALQAGQQNMLIVNIVNADTMPAFRVRVAIVTEDHSEVHSAVLGTALAHAPMTFAELTQLGRKQNAWLDHEDTARKLEACLAATEATGSAPDDTPLVTSVSLPANSSVAMSDDVSQAPATPAELRMAIAQHERMRPSELTVEELEEGRDAVMSVHLQACALVKCAHDAVAQLGIQAAQALLSGPLELRELQPSGEGFSVHGRSPPRGCFGRSQPWSYFPPTWEAAMETQGKAAAQRGAARRRWLPKWWPRWCPGGKPREEQPAESLGHVVHG